MDFFNILFNQRYEGHRGDLIEQLFAAAAGGGGGSATSFSGTPPFMLLNAVAKAIKKLVQFGKVEQADTPTPSAPVDLMFNNGKFKAVDSELPLGYKRITGISFDGNSWYDTDEYLYGSDVITMTLDGLSTSGQNVFGAYSGTTEGKENLSFYAYGSTSSGSYLRYGETLYRPKLGTGERTISFGAGGTSGFYENVSFSEAQFTTTDKAWIGALPNSTSPKYTGSIIGDILVGTRLRFVPCERESDGAIGYYEMVKGVFLENEGSGTPVSLGYDTTHLTPRVVGEPEVISLVPVVGEETVSGSIASFPDGAEDIPMSSVKASINPIQDLHGQTSPYPAGGGVNLLFVNSRVNTTIADVTYTSDDDYITLNGTKNGQGYADLSALTITLDAGTYYFRAFNISGSVAGSDYALYAFDGTSNLTGTIFSEKSLTLEETKTIRFRFGIFTNGIVFTNYKIGIVVSKTSGISTYSPYSNICPISGTTEVNVFVEDTYDASADPTATVNLGQTVYGGTVDVVSGVLTVDRAMVDLGTLNWLYSSGTKRMYSTGINSVSKHPASDTVVANILCEIYATDTDAHTASHTSDNICALGSTGILYVYDSAYTDAATFKTAMDGVQLVYELATPITVQLTPQEVTSLLGSNTVWADSGNVEVTYRKVGTAQTASAENLLSVGSYEDTQDIITGAVTRRVGVKVFDGTEDWVAGSQEGLFRLNLPGKKLEKSLYLSSHFVYSSATSTGLTDGQMMCGAASANCYFKNSSTTTLSDFTAWLAAQYAAGTPVVVLYPLAQEVTESVAAQSLRPVKGDNVITVKANVDDIEFEGEYIAK